MFQTYPYCKVHSSASKGGLNEESVGTIDTKPVKLNKLSSANTSDRHFVNEVK